MNPLAVEIWLSMLGAYVMVSLTIWIVARFSPYEWIEPTPCPSCKCPLQVGSRRVVLIDYGTDSSETDAERCREKIDELKFQSQFFSFFAEKKHHHTEYIILHYTLQVIIQL